MKKLNISTVIVIALLALFVYPQSCLSGDWDVTAGSIDWTLPDGQGNWYSIIAIFDNESVYHLGGASYPGTVLTEFFMMEAHEDGTAQMIPGTLDIPVLPDDEWHGWHQQKFTKLDEHHFLVSHQHFLNYGYLHFSVISIDHDDWSFTYSDDYAYQNHQHENSRIPSFSKIDESHDESHVLCTYVSGHFPGDEYTYWAMVLTIEHNNWTVSTGTPFQLDPNSVGSSGQGGDLSRIDDTHYLYSYTGTDFNYWYSGWSVVLTVNPDDWTVTSESPFQFEPNEEAFHPVLSQIDDTHYLCTYVSFTNQEYLGWAVVLSVNTNDWTISRGTPFNFDVSWGAPLSKIDDYHYMCTYSVDDDGYVFGRARVLEVDSEDWSVSNVGMPARYSTGYGVFMPHLSRVDDSRVMCAYQDARVSGLSLLLNVEIPPTSVDHDISTTPHNYSLMQNYPNPFNMSTTISYYIPQASSVKLDIYNLLGQKIETLVNQEQTAGYYQVNWHADDFTSGMYFFRLQAGNYIDTKKMTLLK